jgi:hypothetical protein
MRRSGSGLLVTALLVGACAAPASSMPAPSTAAPPVLSPTPQSTPEVTPTPAPTAVPSILTVSAFSNIFGAGHDRPPAPAGGGAGRLPAEWPLPDGGRRIATFPVVTGMVFGRVGQAPANGPGGETGIGTDVVSFGGISGIVHENRAMFLVGVFLTDAEPADPAPKRLDFTDNEDFELLEPEIAQTFLIGDGVGRRYLAPEGATRLFLGFAEGMFYVGRPGFYGNNEGELQVKVDVAVE